MDRWQAYQRRRILREQIIAYKGGKCCICKYDRCPSALELHHPDPLVKEFTISKRLASIESIKPELDKCILACANCHREIHDGWHPGYLADDRSEGSWSIDEDD